MSVAVRKALACALVVSMVACSDVKSQTFTPSNHEAVVADAVKHMNDDDKQKLVAALIRSAFGYQIDGKTVGTVIAEQTAFQQQQKAQEEALHQAQVKAEQQRAAIARQIASVLTVVPLSKSFSANNFMGSTEGGYEPHGDQIDITVSFRNLGKKVITAFKGNLAFTNAFGDKIYSVSFDQAQHLQPGSVTNWSGSIRYNSYEESQQKFRNTNLSDMKSHFEATAVSFADGTILKADSAAE